MIIDLLMLFLDLELIDEGIATAYNKGVMEQVVQNRLRYKHVTQEQVDAAIGFVATQDKQYIGDWVVIDFGHGLWGGPYLVTDCGQAGHQEQLDKKDFAVDLEYKLAKRLRRLDRPMSNVKVYRVRASEPSLPGSGSDGTQEAR